MKAFYVTEKQVNEYIERELLRFDSLNNFRQELERSIADCDESCPAQYKFFTRVLKALN